MKDFDIKFFIENSFDDTPTIGVYELFLNDELIYVGQSVDVKSRILQHVRAGEIFFDSFNVTNCEKSELNDIEASYIIERGPKRNLTIPVNSIYCTRSAIQNEVMKHIKEKTRELDVVHSTGNGHMSNRIYIRKPTSADISTWLEDFKFTVEGK